MRYKIVSGRDLGPIHKGDIVLFVEAANKDEATEEYATKIAELKTEYQENYKLTMDWFDKGWLITKLAMPWDRRTEIVEESDAPTG